MNPSKPRAAYFIHRVGPVGPQRDANIAAALRWIKFLVDALPEIPISAPWMPYVLALDETRYRGRGMHDGQVFADADIHDIGIVCGPEMSTGCGADRDRLLNDHRGRGVLDLTGLGLVDPPTSAPDAVDFVRNGVDTLWTLILGDRGSDMTDLMAPDGVLVCASLADGGPRWHVRKPA